MRAALGENVAGGYQHLVMFRGGASSFVHRAALPQGGQTGKGGGKEGRRRGMNRALNWHHHAKRERARA